MRTRGARWIGRFWRNLKFVVVGMALQSVGWTIVGLPWAYMDFPTMYGITLELVATLVVVLFCAGALTRAQRWRFRTMLGVDIPEPPVVDARRNWQGLRALTRSESTRRQMLYHLVVGPAIGFGALLALCAGPLILVFTAVLAWYATPGLPGHTTAFDPDAMFAGLPGAGHPVKAVYLLPAGSLMLVTLLVVPLLIGALARWDTSAARALLGPNRADELERRVEGLTESREAVVEAADAERRRIERDLHDGAQQRLTSLAMNLGLARATLTDLPDPARQAIADAHEEAKEAIAELRNLVRGLHPAILEDRGLDAALSGIAARSPVPVRLSVDVPARPVAKIEAVAYFVVAEALTNAARYSGASGVDVVVERFGGSLLVVVSDDGVGGADPARGSGLTGLARRVGSVDGTFEVSSPAGGPTVISVELPCAL